MIIVEFDYFDYCRFFIFDSIMIIVSWFDVKKIKILFSIISTNRLDNIDFPATYYQRYRTGSSPTHNYNTRKVDVIRNVCCFITTIMNYYDYYYRLSVPAVFAHNNDYRHAIG